MASKRKLQQIIVESKDQIDYLQGQLEEMHIENANLGWAARQAENELRELKSAVEEVPADLFEKYKMVLQVCRRKVEEILNLRNKIKGYEAREHGHLFEISRLETCVQNNDKWIKARGEKIDELEYRISELAGTIALRDDAIGRLSDLLNEATAKLEKEKEKGKTVRCDNCGEFVMVGSWHYCIPKATRCWSGGTLDD